jgi:hypothetical protein
MPVGAETLLLQGGVGLSFMLLDVALLVIAFILLMSFVALGGNRLRGRLKGPAVLATVLVASFVGLEVLTDPGPFRAATLSSLLFGRTLTDIDRVPAVLVWPCVFGVMVWLEVGVARVEQAFRRRGHNDRGEQK